MSLSLLPVMVSGVGIRTSQKYFKLHIWMYDAIINATVVNWAWIVMHFTCTTRSVGCHVQSGCCGICQEEDC